MACGRYKNSDGDGFIGFDAAHDKRYKQQTPKELDFQYGRVIQISSGCHHTGVVTEQGVAVTWGSGMHGQLGRKEPKDTRLEMGTLDLSAVPVAELPQRVRLGTLCSTLCVRPCPPAGHGRSVWSAQSCGDDAAIAWCGCESGNVRSCRCVR